jgi:hypothetical protein
VLSAETVDSSAPSRARTEDPLIKSYLADVLVNTTICRKHCDSPTILPFLTSRYFPAFPAVSQNSVAIVWRSRHRRMSPQETRLRHRGRDQLALPSFRARSCGATPRRQRYSDGDSPPELDVARTGLTSLPLNWVNRDSTGSTFPPPAQHHANLRGSDTTSAIACFSGASGGCVRAC